MNLIEFGDCRETMRKWVADGVKAQMCVTSPPYFGCELNAEYGALQAERINGAAEAAAEAAAQPDLFERAA